MSTIRSFWGVGTNVGDTLTPVILEHFTKHKAEWVSSLDDNKLLMCGSILEFAKPGDTVLGAGHYRDEQIDLTDVRVLALRGKLSGKAPAYGDPALLLPLIYKPKVEKSKRRGIIPHLWDQKNYDDYIDVNLPWKKFIDAVVACESVVSTSLHGKIIADAYGVPARWHHYPAIPGARRKYGDYLSGIKDGIAKSQIDLLKALAAL